MGAKNDARMENLYTGPVRLMPACKPFRIFNARSKSASFLISEYHLPIRCRWDASMTNPEM